jgi:hypothetical protein
MRGTIILIVAVFHTSLQNLTEIESCRLTAWMTDIQMTFETRWRRSIQFNRCRYIPIGCLSDVCLYVGVVVGTSECCLIAV